MGSARQLIRHAPGINALCQTDCWLGGDENPPELLLDYFSGRGVSPGLLEWMMGFPPSWTRLPPAGARVTSSAGTASARDAA